MGTVGYILTGIGIAALIAAIAIVLFAKAKKTEEKKLDEYKNSSDGENQ